MALGQTHKRMGHRHFLHLREARLGLHWSPEDTQRWGRWGAFFPDCVLSQLGGGRGRAEPTFPGPL